MPENDFSGFYKNIGLLEYPFSIFTSENERDKADKLFVKPSDYEPIIENFTKKITMLVIGERGTGKTALMYDLQRNINIKDNLIIIVDDYSSLDNGYQLKDFYKYIIINSANCLFERLVHDKKRISKIDRDNKLLLSYLLKKFVPNLTKDNLKNKIERIQHSFVKNVSVCIFNKVRNILNYGATSVANFALDSLTTYFGIPRVDDNVKIHEFFPEIQLGTDESFIDTETSYYFLQKVLSLIKRLGFENTILILDKVDEDSRFKNDAEKVSSFVEKILTDNKFLLMENLQVVISLWAVPFNMLKDKVRTQKHYCPQIRWTHVDLIKALNRRLEVFSNYQVKDYKNMFDSNITETEFNEIFNMANGCPRDLWQLFDKFFRQQYMIAPHSNKISKEAIVNGFSEFVTYFNYYEYYPKRADARANTMDVYAYIKHLLKLDGSTFTKNKLNTLAGTGSSTDNYVAGMEKIGLIKRDAQTSGNTIYTIRDPKVIYALNNRLDLRRD